MYAAEYTPSQAEAAFSKLRAGKPLTESECLQYKSAALYELAAMDKRAGWVLQLASQGSSGLTNSKILKQLGADSGCDSIGGF